MHIRERNRRSLTYVLFIFLLTVLIVCGCKGKEETQPIVAPVGTEQQEKTAGEKGIPSSERPDVAQQPTIMNTAPRITKFNVEPQNPAVGDTVKADVETLDREGDTVTVIYQWSKNGVPLPETSDKISLTGEFKRGDKITVKATPDDGKVKGTPLTVVVYIANASPVAKGVTEPFRLEGDLYTYQVKATDPDGDELAYALKEAPSGMTIDPQKGFIRWKVPPDVTGTSHHTVSVTDGHGGEMLQTFTIDIRSKQSM